MPATISRKRRSTKSRTAGDRVRTVPSSSAVCGRMLSMSPAVKRATETTQESSGSTLRETIVCSAVTICAPATMTSMQLCGKAAWPPLPSSLTTKKSADAIAAPLRSEISPTGSLGALCRRVDFLDGEIFHQSVVEHRLGAAAAFFGRLEDDDRRTDEVAGGGEIARRAEHDRGMAVVAAGVHAAGNGRAIGQVGRLLDRQRVHVGAQADRAPACAPAALDDADDAAATDAGANFVAAEFAQPLGDEGGGLIEVVEKLGMGVEMAAPALRVGNELGDGGVYGHERRTPERGRQNGRDAAALSTTLCGAARNSARGSATGADVNSVLTLPTGMAGAVTVCRLARR